MVCSDFVKSWKVNRVIVLLGGFMSGQGLQLFTIAAIAGTKSVRIELISSSRKDLSCMVTKPTSTGSCFFNLDETQKARCVQDLTQSNLGLKLQLLTQKTTCKAGMGEQVLHHRGPLIKHGCPSRRFATS